MSRQLKIYWLGLTAYAVSFLLTAIGPSALPMRGYFCSVFALVYPFQAHLGSGGPFDGRGFEYISLIISGWINPLFLTTALLDLADLRRFAACMRIVLLGMVPFCWVVFAYEGFHPREGHFLWLIGMLLTLFSRQIAKVFKAGMPGVTSFGD